MPDELIPMTPAELERWKSKQIDAAIAIGVNPLDAIASVNRFVAAVPPGADPRTYIRPAYELDQNLSAPDILADAKAAWVGDVDAKDARMLDAGSEA